MRSALAFFLLSFVTACGSTTATGGGSHEAETDAGALDAGRSHPRVVVTADWLNRSLSVLDYEKLVAGATTRDDALIGTVDLKEYPPGPIEVALTPDNRTAVVTLGPGFFKGVLGPVFGAPDIPDGGGLLLVDLDTLSVVASLSPPAGPLGVAVTKDGKYAFSADHGAGEGRTLSVVDLSTRTLVDSIDLGATSPEETSLSPDGTLGIVNTDGDASVRFYDPSDPKKLTPPLVIGGDPDAAAFVPSQKKVVIAQSLSDSLGKAGYSVIDYSDPAAPKVSESVPLSQGVPYGADVIPGTTHVLVTVGLQVCELDEVDVGTTPSTIVRTIPLHCAKTSLPMSTAIDAEGKHAFVGALGDNSLQVVDLEAGTSVAIPWLAKAGPTHVAVGR